MLKLKLLHRGSLEKTLETVSRGVGFFPLLLSVRLISINHNQNFLWEWATPFQLCTKHLFKVKEIIVHSESRHSHTAQGSYLEHPTKNGSSASFRVEAYN